MRKYQLTSLALLCALMPGFQTLRSQSPQPIYITGMVHIDPLLTNTTDTNAVIASYNSHRNAFLWYVRYADSVGLRLGAQMTGVYAEACVRRGNASDFAAFMPGGIHHLGTHAHLTVKRTIPYVWRTVASQFGSNRDTVRQIMIDNIPWVNAVFTGNGYTSAANWFFHGTQASYPGMDTVLFRYPVPNPYPYDNVYQMCEAVRNDFWMYKGGFLTEPSQSADTNYIKIPEVGGIIGYDQLHGPQGMVYGTVPYQRRDFLRVYIEWRESVRRGTPDAVRYFNWMIHPYQLVPGAVGTDGRPPRVHIQELVAWLRENFIGRTDESGNIVAQFANVEQIRNAHESWRQTYPAYHQQLQAKLSNGQKPLYLPGIIRLLDRTYHDIRLTIADTNIVIHRMMDTVSHQPVYLTWSRSGNRPLEPALTGWFRMIRGDSSTQNLHSGAISIGLEPLVLEPSSPINVQVSVSNRWNIVSVPVTVSDYRKSTLFPTAISPAFAFQGTYVQKDTLTNGVGYWLKFDTAQTVSMAGQMRNTDSISIRLGWNLIGSISQPVPLSSISSDPPGIITSQFFGYQAGYFNSDTIQPGKGYWVKASEGGMLILSSSGAASAVNKIRIMPITELPPPPPDGNTSAVNQLPTRFALHQNYPNPFNPSTKVGFQIKDYGLVTLKVYDVLGCEVATLVNEVKEPGMQTVQWNAGGVASGVYYYRLKAGDFVASKKLLILK